jgi:AraC family transcriptional regulator, positive regulator of tynA and feaB
LRSRSNSSMSYQGETTDNAGTNQAARRLTSDEWTSSLRIACANDLVGIDPKTFVGWFNAFQVYGLTAVSAGSNIARINRSQTHARRDGLEDYSLIFQLTGRSGINHNDTLFELQAGELVLADPTRPMTVFNEPGIVQHMALHLPREQLVAHLGFEPKGALHRNGTAANRLLIQLMVEASQKNSLSDPFSLPEGHMRLVVFDLLAALFAPTGDGQGSAYTDKFFVRVCEMIKANLTNPELTPAAVAAEARISMRYLQKLFSARSTTCSHFIQSLRLDKASRLLQRRALSGGETPLGDIGFACGFLDYAHFSRKFRERFGHPPSAHAAVAVRKQTSNTAPSD